MFPNFGCELRDQQEVGAESVPPVRCVCSSQTGLCSGEGVGASPSSGLGMAPTGSPMVAARLAHRLPKCLVGE